MSIFKGAGVAIVTPMKENGEVNYEKFAEMIEFQIANGTDAIIVCGTTGESSTLTHEEHLDVIKYCTEKVAGRIPVVAGTGSNCTETAVYLSGEAEKYGVDGLLLVSPYYNKATQNGLYTHFKTIAESVKLPIILYNVPSRTGCNILPDTVIRLCHDVENIVGVKEASVNLRLPDWQPRQREPWIFIPVMTTRLFPFFPSAARALFPSFPTWLRRKPTKSALNILRAMWKEAVIYSFAPWICAMPCSVK